MCLDPRQLAAVLLAICAAAGGACRPAAPAVRPRNVLLITIDTWRADRLSGGTTPEITALAARGTRFTDATSHAPLTVPSHVSIMTGQFPSRHGIRDNAGFVLPPDRATLATVLHDRGFRTGAFVAAYVLARHTGLDAGFDLYDDEFDRRAATLTLTSLERRGTEVVDRAAAWIAGGGGPFFAWVHLYDPHAPYDAAPAFAARFPDRPYDAEVAASDWAVASLLRAIPAATREQTLIVVTGDHGEALGEHGEREHGIFLYDVTLAVPLVIAGPGVPRGGRVSDQVRLVDVAPTIADLLGYSWPNGDGASLTTLMNGSGEKGPRLSYAESAWGRLHFGWSELRALRDGEWKYIHAPAPELYALRQDPAERQNLHASRTSVATAMAARLPEHARTGVQPTPAADSFTTEALRSLGYVSGAASVQATGVDPKDRIDDYNQYVDRFNRGLDALETGRAAAAEALFSELTTAFPDSFEAWQYLGRARARRGQHAAALRAYAAALGLRASDAGVLHDAAISEATLGHAGRAQQLLDLAGRLEPKSLSHYLVEGTVWRLNGDTARARAAFDAALKVVPGQAAALFELGRLDEEAGRLDEARARYREALASDATLGPARDALQRLEQRH